MMYLSNLPLSCKPLVEKAALNTGYDVEFRDHPMPKSKETSAEYNPELLKGYGSVYSPMHYANLSPFWKEFHRLRDEEIAQQQNGENVVQFSDFKR